MSFRKVLCILILTTILTLGISAQDIKVDEILSKNIASIGDTKKQSELKNMMLLGASEFRSKLPERKSSGKLAIVSDASNLLFISSFLSDTYPYEKIGYFNGKPNVPFVSAGLRSPLGNFLWEHSDILKSGLFSSSMTLNWNLLEKNLKKSKFSLAGTKKIDGRKAYIVNCSNGATSGSMKIKLYFDAETFRHIRSEYREELAAKESKFGTLGGVSGYEVELTENFSNFKTFEGITLPGTSKVHYMDSSRNGTHEYDWDFNVIDVKFNQQLKDGFFNF